MRDFTKWNDGPRTLENFADSVVRAHKIAMTTPRGPVVIAVDQDLQEREVPRGAKFVVPPITNPIPPSADAATLQEIARLLVAAEFPVILAGKMRTGASLPLLIELAEALQAPVISRDGLRTNFPNRHHLHQAPEVVSDADVLLALELTTAPRASRPDGKTITITASDLDIPDNYHSAGRYGAVNMSVAADAEASLPYLIETVKRLVTPDRRSVFEARGRKFQEVKAQELDRARLEAAFAWNASPIANGRLTAELWDVIRNEDWSLVGGGISTSISGWGSGFERFFWNFDKSYRSVGWLGGGGLGNGPGVRLAPRSRTASMAVCRSACRTTATSCTAPGSSGPQRITGSRC